MGREPACLTHVTLAIAVMVLVPALGSAQSVRVSPRATLLGGDERAGSVGVRLAIGSSRLRVFGHAGYFGLDWRCDASLPPTCNAPASGGKELLGGVQLALAPLGGVRPTVAVGAGALIWNDSQPNRSGVAGVWEGEVGIEMGAFRWADLTLGLSARSVGQSVSGGMRLVRDRGSYVGVVVGLSIPARN